MAAESECRMKIVVQTKEECVSPAEGVEYFRAEINSEKETATLTYGNERMVLPLSAIEGVSDVMNRVLGTLTCAES